MRMLLFCLFGFAAGFATGWLPFPELKLTGAGSIVLSAMPKPLPDPVAPQPRDARMPVTKSAAMPAAVAAKWAKVKANVPSAALATLSAWSQEDLADAVAWALASAGGKGEMLSGADLVLAAWAQRDFDAALEATLKLENKAHRAKCLGALLVVLAVRDLDRAMTLFAREARGNEANEMVIRLVEVWSSMDLRGAVLAAYQRPELLRFRNARIQASIAAAKMLPSLDALVALARETGHPAAEAEMVHSGLNRFVSDDPVAAWRWYQSGATHGDDSAVPYQLMQALAKAEPTMARDIVLSLAGNARLEAAQLFLDLGTDNPGEMAKKWTLIAPGLTTEERARMLGLWIRSAGNAVAVSDERLTLAATPEERAAMMAGGAMNQLKARSFHDAFDSAMRIEQQAVQREVLIEISRGWAAADAAAARDRAISMVPSEARDWLLCGVAGELAGNDPSRMLALLPDVGSPAAQKALLRNVAVSMARASPVNASRWMDSQPSLSAADRTLIQDAVANGSPGGIFLPDGRWIAKFKWDFD